MNDDRMDELLVNGARDYNEPGVVPREEMWARIAEARRGAGNASRGTKPIATLRAVWIGLALAAGVVLAIGIGIGRGLERTTPTKPPVVAATPTTPGSSPAKADTLIPRLREETRSTDRRAQVLASTPVAPSEAGDRASEPNLAYRLVMLRHIAGSEAMITAFRASARRGEVDAQIASWSRELLSTTRLLESSPITQDPTMKRLLDDLDLVIVQIAQYASRGTVNQEELDLIEQSINKRGVITKLRTPLPVRTAPTGL